MRKSNEKQHLSFRCPYPSQTYTSVSKDSFFSLYSKPFNIILQLIQFWAISLTIANTLDMCKIKQIDIGHKVVRTTFRRLRNICSFTLKQKPVKLGGTEKIVEIDETLVAKIKYNRGSGLKRKQVWLFGMVERGETGKCFLTMVPNRKAQALLQLIYNHVHPGTVIISHSWSSYNKLTTWFEHKTVNHTYNFIDPDTSSKFYQVKYY